MSWLKQKPPILVYTDGSCFPAKRGAHGGWAAIILKDGEEIILTGGETPSTNNRMEMMAVLKALEYLEDGSNVFLYTDSQYVQKGITIWLHGWEKRGWKTLGGADVANQDLWQLIAAEARRHVVSWHWVKGHGEDDRNNRCDALAGTESALRLTRYGG